MRMNRIVLSTVCVLIAAVGIALCSDEASANRFNGCGQPAGCSAPEGCGGGGCAGEYTVVFRHRSERPHLFGHLWGAWRAHRAARFGYGGCAGEYGCDASAGCGAGYNNAPPAVYEQAPCPSCPGGCPANGGGDCNCPSGQCPCPPAAPADCPNGDCPKPN
jgi:hypothetical protein